MVLSSEAGAIEAGVLLEVPNLLVEGDPHPLGCQTTWPGVGAGLHVL